MCDRSINNFWEVYKFCPPISLKGDGCVRVFGSACRVTEISVYIHTYIHIQVHIVVIAVTFRVGWTAIIICDLDRAVITCIP